MQSDQEKNKYIFNKFFWFGLFPLLFYFISFSVLTYPVIFQFNAQIYGDGGDGFQNLWNLWWFNKSILELHQNPFWTGYLFYPNGAHLWAHTLQPFNGVVALVLTRFFSMIVSYNIIVVGTFVFSGLFMMYLAFQISRSYWGSLLAGYFFTFTGYRFGHLLGHMNLISTQFLPLFLLFLILYFKKRSYFNAVGLALSLFFCMTIDLFYGYLCLLFLLFTFFYFLFKNYKGKIRKMSAEFVADVKTNKKIYATLFIVVLLTTGIYASLYFYNTTKEPLRGKGGTKSFSLDLLSPFVYGAVSKYKDYTAWHWQKIRNIPEMSVYVGNALLFLFGYALIKRKKIKENLSANNNFNDLNFWLVFALVFFLLAMGPVIKIYGEDFDMFMPWDLADKIIPLWDSMRTPARFMLPFVVSLSVVFALMFKYLARQKKLWIALAVAAVGMIELVPAKITTTSLPGLPEYYKIVSDTAEDESVFDMFNGRSAVLYYQTIHGKKLTEGYISRTPKSSYNMVKDLKKLIEKGFEKNAETIYDKYKVRYVLMENKSRSCNEIKKAEFCTKDLVILDLKKYF